MSVVVLNGLLLKWYPCAWGGWGVTGSKNGHMKKVKCKKNRTSIDLPPNTFQPQIIFSSESVELSVASLYVLLDFAYMNVSRLSLTSSKILAAISFGRVFDRFTTHCMKNCLLLSVLYSFSTNIRSTWLCSPS